MRKHVKRIRIAEKRVCRAAAAFIQESRDETPRLWTGKKLFDLQMRLGKASDALNELKNK